LRPPHWLFLLRIASLLGLAVSVMVLIDYSAPEMAFCSSSSGCGAVRDSGFGFVVLPSGEPIPYLPMLGVLNFAGLFAASLLGGARQRHIAVGSLALASGAAGLALLAVQALLIERFCSLCLVVDGSALVVAVSHLGLRRAGWERATALEMRAGTTPVTSDLCVRPLAWLALGVLAVAAPLAFKSVARTEQLPEVIARLHHPERVTVVEFFDYECPHCRIALPELKKAIQAFGRPVHIIRQPIGLKGHKLGQRAARVHVCAAEQVASEAVLEVLMEGGPILTEEHFARLERLELDHPRLRACVESDRPDQALGTYLSRIEQAEFLGLPTIYIGSTRLIGSAPYEVYLEALEKAEARRDGQGVPPAVYWALVSLLALATLGLGWVRLPAAPARAA